MKVTLFRDVVGLVALGASLGCSGVSTDGPLYPVPAPVNPPGTPPPQPPVTYGSPPPFPAISDAVAIYTGPERLYDVLIESHGSSLPTRYVFFHDSTFQLQFASARFGIFTYSGRYSRTGATLTFQWDGSGASAPWAATGTLRGDTLDVRYNLNMSMSDFIDGPYILVR